LCLVIVGVLLVSAALGVIGKRLIGEGRIPAAAMISGLAPIRDLLVVRSGVDSWAPMLAALHQIEQHPEISVYQAVFFDRHMKFQYPLTSLLPFWAANSFGMNDRSILAALRFASWLAVCSMAGISAVMGVVLLGKYSVSGPPGSVARTIAIVGILLACFLFYPFMRGYELGQAQTFLALGFAIAFFCWIRGQHAVSGAILGALTLVKPQYGVILIWMILRRKTNAAASFLACAVAGLALSVVLFGWHQNIEYVKVLQVLSRQGESFYANQSINGILNRLLFNGTNLVFNEGGFPPFNVTVYIGTLLSSIAILGVALFFPWKSNRGTAADFACAGLAATMASPVAWDHHYGILFPIFIWLFFGPEMQLRSSLRAFALGTAYVLASNCLNIANLLARVPVLNLLQSYLFAAALIIFTLLLTSPLVKSRAVQSDVTVP
jgi:hypothetical protein